MESRLIEQIQSCRACHKQLPLGPRPVVQAHAAARILIVGQAPGLKVHETGIPWNDASGERLREWLGVSLEDFYDSTLFALVPIGFCYPGRGPSGDLPPRPECYELWHEKLQKHLSNIRLTLLVGTYAQAKYLGPRARTSATETIRHWREYLPTMVPLPHPSPRNNIWLHKNTWFSKDVLPEVRKLVRASIRS